MEALRIVWQFLAVAGIGAFMLLTYCINRSDKVKIPELLEVRVDSPNKILIEDKAFSSSSDSSTTDSSPDRTADSFPDTNADSSPVSYIDEEHGDVISQFCGNFLYEEVEDEEVEDSRWSVRLPPWPPCKLPFDPLQVEAGDCSKYYRSLFAVERMKASLS